MIGEPTPCCTSKLVPPKPHRTRDARALSLRASKRIADITNIAMDANPRMAQVTAWRITGAPLKIANEFCRELCYNTSALNTTAVWCGCSD